MTSPWVRAVAPAKVNLTLAVLGKRDDGFHELATHMLALDLADEVSARARGDGALTLAVRGPTATPDVPADERNLVWRAAAAVLDELFPSGERPGLDLSVVKRVPSQAGLGGASADAAATVLAAEKALDRALPTERRGALLARLGSDCAFFTEAEKTGFALCEGRGERVSPLAPPSTEWRVALVTPVALASTAAVYGALSSLSGLREAPRVVPARFPPSATEARAWLFNDLEEAAVRSVPALAAWRDSFRAAQAEHFRLSGSGSSFFAIFDDDESARRTLDAVLAEARARGLEYRGEWIARPAGRGARLL